MKSIIYAFLGITLYILVGVIFYGNHYWMLPVFLILIFGMSFLLNRRHDLPLIKRNLLWTAVPFGLILIISGLIVNPLSLTVIAAYIVSSILSLIGVYYTIRTIQKQKAIKM